MGVGIFLCTVLLLSACSDKQSESIPGDSVQLEAGAQVATVEQSTNQAGNGSFNSTDLPIDPGRQLVYASNRPGTKVPVSFDLAGPWMFDGGPGEATLTVTISSTDSAPASGQFTDAVAASGASWTQSAAGTEYNFQSKDDSTLYSYGRSFANGGLVVFSSPSRALIFPMAVGDNWIDTYTEQGDGKPVEVVAENTVLARNQLTVPAGTFDAWLLQTKVTAKSAGITTTTLDYSWFVPGVGRAAEIISQTDERREVFGTARAFYRLKSYR